MSTPHPDRPPPSLSDAVHAEQVRMLYAGGPSGYLVSPVAALVLAGLLVWQGTLHVAIAAACVFGAVVVTAGRIYIREAYVRARPAMADWRLWARRFTLGAAAGGLVWAVAIPLLLAPGRFELQALVLSVLTAGTYGLIGSVGSYRPALYTFLVPFPSTIAWLLVEGDVLARACAVILIFWLPTVLVMGRQYNATLSEALRLRFENAALAEDLRAQTDAARETSQAKSRFLAAASHDLRQPVHALGMLIGALRSHRLPKRSAELVDRMDGSIGALDGLFRSLLDISRLDAGVIESRPETVPLQPMLERICRDLEPEAEAKGVDIVLSPTVAAVRSDPVLLERVLRNLIGNAVRYTERGWVLVGCRGKGGLVSLEVRDTGPGIPAELHAAVFEEFFQIGNADRDRSKGLGLGLPIVKRLTALLDHPLEMESAPGEGSTFRVLAPLAPLPVAVPETTPGADLRTGLVLAIDDEHAIRVAMQALLESWGHRVVSAACGTEAVEALDGETPDVIVCDYRLRQGETGLEAIRHIHKAVGSRPPAILVTGETAPDRLREAQASGYPLLHKPLSHAKLRAAVASLIRRRQVAMAPSSPARGRGGPSAEPAQPA